MGRSSLEGVTGTWYLSLLPVHHFIKPLTNFHHPLWQFLHCLINQGIGHLLVIGIGHGICNVTNSLADHVILHKLVVMLYYCKDIELFRKFQVNGEVFCEVTPSQGLWRSNNHSTTEETEVNGKCGNSYHIYTATL